MRRALSLLLSVLVIFSAFSCFTIGTNAGNYDTILTAKSVSMNVKTTGSLTSADPTEIFKFSLTSSSKVDVELYSTVFRFQFSLMNEKGEVIYDGGEEEGASGLCTLLDSMALVKGVYYFRVSKNYESRDGIYEITFKSSAANETFVETADDNNNSALVADSISSGRNYKGQLALNDKADFYVLNLSSTSAFTLNFLSDEIDALYVDILDEKYSNVESWYLTQSTNKCTINETLSLLKGKYYISVKQAYGYGNYNFSFNYSSYGESIEETQTKRNDTKTDAYQINLNTDYKGVLALNDGNDYYKFKLTNKTSLRISFQAEILSACYVDIYDDKGNTIFGKYLTMGTNNCVIDEIVDLNAGNYYFAIIQAYGKGIYNFNLSDRPATPKTKAVNTIKGMKVTWNAVSGAAKYVVYRRLGTSSTWSIIATTTGTSFEDKGSLVAGNYYVYSVKAYNSAGTPSDYVKANCASVQRVVAPYTKAANAIGGINVTWGKVAGANKYVVLRRIGTESTWKTLCTTTGTSFLDKNVTPGIYYIYSIRAVNGTGYSEYDINKRVTIQRILTPKASAVNKSNGIQLSWNTVTSATKYNVYRRLSGTNTWVYVGTTTGNTLLDKGVVKGKTYAYSIRAINGTGYSAYDSSKCASIKRS